MKTRTIPAAFASATVTFLLSWLVFGILLINFYNTNATHYAGLMKDRPEMWAIIIANICYGFMLAFILNLAGIKSPVKGFTTGFLIILLGNAGFDLMYYATINMYGLNVLVVDILTNAIIGGLSGAVSALVLGSKY